MVDLNANLRINVKPESDGWIRQVSEGKSTYTYDASINTIDQAKKAGYTGALNVLESATIIAENGDYGFDLAENGLVQNIDTKQYVNVEGGMTTEGGTTITSSTKSTNEIDSMVEVLGNTADGVGLGMATQEAVLNYAQRTVQAADDFGDSATKLLKVTQNIGAIGGAISAGVAIYDAVQKPTPGSIAKAVGNTALAVLKLNPIYGIVTGIMDATGVSDKIYEGIGNYVNDNIVK